MSCLAQGLAQDHRERCLSIHLSILPKHPGRKNHPFEGVIVCEPKQGMMKNPQGKHTIPGRFWKDLWLSFNSGWSPSTLSASAIASRIRTQIPASASRFNSWIIRLGCASLRRMLFFLGCLEQFCPPRPHQGWSSSFFRFSSSLFILSCHVFHMCRNSHQLQTSWRMCGQCPTVRGEGAKGLLLSSLSLSIIFFAPGDSLRYSQEFSGHGSLYQDPGNLLKGQIDGAYGCSFPPWIWKNHKFWSICPWSSLHP